MTRRIIALSVIFICSWVAWAVLTLVIHFRTDEKSQVVSDAVGQLWGTEHTQVAPVVTAQWTTTTRREVKSAEAGWEYVGESDDGDAIGDGDSGDGDSGDGDGGDGTFLSSSSNETAERGPCKAETSIVSKKIITKKGKKKSGRKKKKKPVEKSGKGDKKNREQDTEERSFEVVERRHSCDLSVAATDASVDLDVEHRKKGLLWFSLYGVDFDASYLVENSAEFPVEITVKFSFPSKDAVFDNMMIAAPKRTDLKITTEQGQMVGRFTLPAKTAQKVGFGYQSRGMDRWSYRFGSDVKIVRNFRLAMHTNYDEIDFPQGSISPDSKQSGSGGTGWSLVWDKESLVSGLEIGMLMPHRINPGPLAEAMSLHAPVSLFFFFFVIFILQVLRGIKIHPMNYFFIAASFFAFNLLFSYLVDHLEIYLAFGLASAVSIFLVVSYLRLVVNSRFALIEAGAGQLVYQVLFSLAHFLEGYTGLTVTIGAIVTLAIVMRLTARIDWEDVFKSKANKNGNGKHALQTP